MISIATALLIATATCYEATNEYQHPASERYSEPIADYQTLPSKETVPYYTEEADKVHASSGRIGRLPQCVHALVFPCEVQKIYLEKFLDENNIQLTVEDLEHMNNDIVEIFPDETEQNEIYNDLDLLLEESLDEVLAFGLNVLEGNVELAFETLQYAMKGEAIWEVEVEIVEDTTEPTFVATFDESTNYPKTFMTTAVEEEAEITGEPVKPEQKQFSYLAPSAPHHKDHKHGDKASQSSLKTFDHPTVSGHHQGATKEGKIHASAKATSKIGERQGKSYRKPSYPSSKAVNLEKAGHRGTTQKGKIHASAKATSKRGQRKGKSYEATKKGKIHASANATSKRGQRKGKSYAKPHYPNSKAVNHEKAVHQGGH